MTERTRSTPKARELQVGDTVYHKTPGDPIRGIVIATNLVEVDWGPEHESVVHHPTTLTTAFVPDYVNPETT